MSKKREKPNITIKLETITPERAKRDLEKSFGKNPRTWNKEQSAIWSTAMRDGLWELNGETIKYNCDDLLIDGQHRFQACVMADKSFQAFVAYNVPSDVNIDTGRSRRIADILRRNGEIYFTTLSGALWWVWKVNEYGWPHTSPGKAPHSVLLKLLKSQPTIRECVSFASNATDRSIGMHSMLSAFMFFASQKDADLAQWFIEKLGNGVDLKENEPVRRLRERIRGDREAAGTRRMSTKMKVAITIKAWNFTRRGEECTILRWLGSGLRPEAFPEIE